MDSVIAVLLIVLAVLFVLRMVRLRMNFRKNGCCGCSAGRSEDCAAGGVPGARCRGDGGQNISDKQEGL